WAARRPAPQRSNRTSGRRAGRGPTARAVTDSLRHDDERRGEGTMRGIVSEYELEALPELGEGYGALELHEPYSVFDEEMEGGPVTAGSKPSLFDLIKKHGLRKNREDQYKLADLLFNELHPERGGKLLRNRKVEDPDLIDEYDRLFRFAGRALSASAA